MRLAQAEKQAGLGYGQTVLSGCGFQIIFQKLPVSVDLHQDALPGDRLAADLGVLFPQFFAARQDGRRNHAVPGGIHKKAVDLEPFLFIIRFVKNLFIEIIVVFKYHQLHSHGIGDASALAG